MSGARVVRSRTGRTVRRVVAGLACLAAIAATGCNVEQQVEVRLSGSGAAEIRVVLQRLFVEYLLTLAEVSGDAEQESGTVFDLEELTEAVNERPGVHLEWVASPTPERLEVRLAFDDLASVLEYSTEAAAEAGVMPVISLTGDPRRTLRVHLSGDNYHQLTTLFPALDNPLLVGLGPQPDLEVTDPEYLEMIAFVLGEGGTGRGKRVGGDRDGQGRGAGDRSAGRRVAVGRFDRDHHPAAADLSARPAARLHHRLRVARRRHRTAAGAAHR